MAPTACLATSFLLDSRAAVVDNIIQEYVQHSLRSMSKACREIRFVSTSVLPDSELAKIRPHVRETLEIENIGLDFYMWKRSLHTVPHQNLTNWSS